MVQKKKAAERKIVTYKLDRKEWEKQIRKSVQDQQIRAQRREKKERIERAKQYKKYLPVPIVIGVIACIVMWNEFGARKLAEHVLSWTIGITIVGTLMAAMKRL